MATDTPSEKGTDDASIIAEQEAFLSSGSQPAARSIRTSYLKGGEPQANIPQDEDDGLSQGPGWYQQMKGVRFRLDDLGDDHDENSSDQTSRRRKGTVQTTNTSPLGSAILGDIVERETSSTAPVFVALGSGPTTKGFPAPRVLRRSHGQNQSSPSLTQMETPTQLEGKALMEEIDRENRKKLAEMNEDEILELQQSLQQSLPAALQEALLNKPVSLFEPSAAEPLAEAPVKSSSWSRSEKVTIPFAASSSTTTTDSSKKPSRTIDDTVNEESFDAHLRSFFPPSTTAVPQPEWTLPVHPAEEAFYSVPDNASPLPASMRFDFKGKYISPPTSHSFPTYLGLHHHSLDPGAAGYTLAELSILARSVQPSQKCIALKIIGHVLADVASGKYEWDVSEALWDEIDRERIIEILLDVAKGGKETGGNRSVQRYAEDAVTRWVDAGGPQIWEDRLRKRGFEKVDDQTN